MKQRNEIGEDEQYDNDDRVETPRKRRHNAEEIQGQQKNSLNELNKLNIYYIFIKLINSVGLIPN